MSNLLTFYYRSAYGKAIGRSATIILVEEEYQKYLRREFPIIDVYANGRRIWLDEKDNLHRDGDKPAMLYSNGDGDYYNHGKFVKFKAYDGRVYFLREKIITLQKLLEIPELYQEVYYTHKGKFMSLLKKL